VLEWTVLTQSVAYVDRQTATTFGGVLESTEEGESCRRCRPTVAREAAFMGMVCPDVRRGRWVCRVNRVLKFRKACFVALPFGVHYVEDRVESESVAYSQCTVRCMMQYAV